MLICAKIYNMNQHEPQLIGEILSQGLPEHDAAAEEQRAAEVEARRIEHYAHHLRDLLAQRRSAEDSADLADINDEIEAARTEVLFSPRTDYKDQ